MPGIILAELWPKAQIGLLDASERRCGLLEQWVAEAGWIPRVWVLCGRAEDLGRDVSLRGTFDAVVARLFGPPAVTAECAAPFLRVGGFLVVSDPPRRAPDPPAERSGERPSHDTNGSEHPYDPGPSQERWPPRELESLGLEPAMVITTPFHFTVLRQSRTCPERYPRRTGVPAKRPLF